MWFKAIILLLGLTSTLEGGRMRCVVPILFTFLVIFWSMCIVSQDTLILDGQTTPKESEGNIRRTIMIVLIVVVSVLVLMAFYSNRHKFSGLSTARYQKINISNPVSVVDLAEKYSDSSTEEKFVSELKKINDLSSDKIEKRTILIPVYNSN